MKKTMRTELRIGILINAIFLVLNRFTAIPEIVLGILFGLGICFMLIGILSEKKYLALKNWKRSVFR